MTPQSSFMILATIVPEREERLRELLASTNSAPGFADPHNLLIPYYQFQQLHYARFVIIRANTNDDIKAHGVAAESWQPKLAFLGDVDGDRDRFLAELVVRAGAGLMKIFSHCVEFDTDQSNLLVWLQRHSQPSIANYINWRGRTVQQIKQEQVLALSLNEKLLELALDSPKAIENPRWIHAELRNYVDQESAALKLKLTPRAATPTWWFLKNTFHFFVIPFVALLLSPLLLVASPLLIFYLRRLERSDPENSQRADVNHLRELNIQEDHDVTNHFNLFGQVKPGLFRLILARVLLVVLNYASRHVYNKGFLTRIQTIHFARWVLLDDGKRVYFASNYDGSVDSYMDDFINKVAWGLNLVIGNGVGYPRTRYIVKGGAEFEGKYKKTLQRNQLPSESWYKAYPGLTAVDLARHSRIRRGLQKTRLSDRQLGDWISLLKISDPAAIQTKIIETKIVPEAS